MSDTVTVHCRVTNGIVMLGHQIRGYQRDMGGPRCGAAAGVTLDGFGVTEGVSREVWERWSEVNKDADIVMRRLIRAAP
jgi:hypothetical protein